jgi:hypothetical protein
MPPATLAKESCNSHYLVFDIGSSTTKSFLYNNKSFKLEKTSNYPFSYQSCLNESSNNQLSQSCIKTGTALLAKIKKEYNLCNKPKQSFALATAWARNTNNIHQWEAEVNKIQIVPKVISQSYEGELMMEAIKSQIAKEGEQFLAFGIGGGSSQIVRSTDGLNQYHGSFGTDNFTYALQQLFLEEEAKCCATAKDQLFVGKDNQDEVDQVCHEECLTSIPEKNLKEALIFADDLIGKPIREDKELQAFIKVNKPKIYASSLLFSLGIKKQLQLNKNQVTLKDLEKLMKILSGKTLTEIKTLYPTMPDQIINTAEPAIILLYTILKNLDLEGFEIVEVDYMKSFLISSIKK